MCILSPAGSTLKCSIAVMAQVAVFNALFVTITLADKGEHDLDLLSKAQGFDLNAFWLAWSGAALSCDINAKGYLGNIWNKNKSCIIFLFHAHIAWEFEDVADLFSPHLQWKCWSISFHFHHHSLFHFCSGIDMWRSRLQEVYCSPGWPLRRETDRETVLVYGQIPSKHCHGSDVLTL